MKNKEKNKRVMSIIMTIIMILNVSTMVSANSLETGNCHEHDNIFQENINLFELNVGDIIYINDIAERVIEISEDGEVKTILHSDRETFNNCNHSNGYITIAQTSYSQYYNNNASMCYIEIEKSTNRCLTCSEISYSYKYGSIVGHKYWLLSKKCQNYDYCNYQKS